jgi:hypothetical protein
MGLVVGALQSGIRSMVATPSLPGSVTTGTKFSLSVELGKILAFPSMRNWGQAPSFDYICIYIDGCV